VTKSSIQSVKKGVAKNQDRQAKQVKSKSFKQQAVGDGLKYLNKR